MDSEKVELLIDRVLSKRRIVGDITSTQVHDVIKDNNQALKEEWAQGSDVMKTGLEASTELALQQWYVLMFIELLIELCHCYLSMPMCYGYYIEGSYRVMHWRAIVGLLLSYPTI